MQLIIIIGRKRRTKNYKLNKMLLFCSNANKKPETERNIGVSKTEISRMDKDPEST